MKSIRNLTAITVALIFVVCVPASASTVNIMNISIDIDVESDVNDWQWNFEVKVPISVLGKEVSSFHVRGLPGDVTDTFEYEDFQPGALVSPGWSVSTSSADDSINFLKSSSGLKPLTAGGSLTFSFDSDYNFSDVNSGSFDIGLDFRDDPSTIHWSTVSTIPPIPLPATLPLFMAGLAVISRFGYRRKKIVST